ncbi:multiple inositol polyphosphate phosphatase 1 [Topomyia yanbarensis]|uniref:multiple inositol polyphosphate phosphatase 1 n=1 Tax=Topomyia yanbarensis TaxID=2498891 RepID=UPI00273B31D9|nr:multiple inositol polyphosphate phosphatase 1 [Topomyia yanbarensis]XP_058829523.1 multiple inositol polyphosphate phosphatase 1 [Topomyia yanbarensis]XP_058829524.1 multiple inositol polyphosphate phosphatase 1 [Topomyia yanbarensis]XP_058829525.1 multiple inositol polyphosphate phosphatase 1 [Topomyia yanbarensis]
MVQQRYLITSLLLWFVYLGKAQQRCCETYCYSQDSDRTQSKHFATKTAYEVIRAPISSREHIVPNCIPSKLWQLSRHGTRLPGKESIQFMSQALNNLRDSILDNYDVRRTAPDVGRMCADDLELLRNWRWDSNITVDYGSFLTLQGWNDLKFLAKREQDRYYEVMSGQYTKEHYLFRYTDSQRTEASYKAFVEGLFGDNAYSNIDVQPAPKDDTLLKPYDFCPAYDANKNKNKQSNSEWSKFLVSRLYLETLADISTRLGFRYNLSTEQVEAMWDACRYEQAWHLQQLSPWCSVFTKEQVNVLEYKEDLSYYYQNSYGYDKSANLACYAVADMMKHLSRPDNPQVVAYFTHESEIQLFLAALGALKDLDALRADNYYAMRNRRFRSSALTPFASNVLAVKYQCADPVEPVKVIFFLNEKALMFDWCNVGLCNWSEVVRQFRRYTDGDCAKIYRGGSTASGRYLPPLTISLLVTVVVALVAKPRITSF